MIEKIEGKGTLFYGSSAALPWAQEDIYLALSTAKHKIKKAIITHPSVTDIESLKRSEGIITKMTPFRFANGRFYLNFKVDIRKLWLDEKRIY